MPPRLAETLDDELSLDEVKEALLKYSLIRTDGDAISIHRLVQEVTRQQLSTEERDQWLTAALRAVSVLFPRDSDDVRTWPVCALWLAHARTVVNWDRAEELDADAASRLLNQAAVYLQYRAEYAEAEPLYRRALGIWEKNLGEQHPQVATGLNNLALLLSETNRVAEAEPLLRRALDIDEQSLGPNHPTVALRLTNLGCLLRDTSRPSEAEPLLRRALAIFEASLGPEHPWTLLCRSHLESLRQQESRGE